MDDLEKLEFNSYAVAVDHEKCKGNTHLVESLRNLVEKGGEGWMLNMPGSKYVGERTGALLKVKVLIPYFNLEDKPKLRGEIT